MEVISLSIVAGGKASALVVSVVYCFLFYMVCLKICFWQACGEEVYGYDVSCSLIHNLVYCFVGVVFILACCIRFVEILACMSSFVSQN